MIRLVITCQKCGKEHTIALDNLAKHRIDSVEKNLVILLQEHLFNMPEGWIYVQVPIDDKDYALFYYCPKCTKKK